MQTWRTILLATFCLFLGCNPKDGSDLNTEFEGIVRTRSSIEFACDSSQIAIQDLDGYAYRATGCGDLAEYECGYSSASGNGCGGHNYWAYECKRAAQDAPERSSDGGSD